MSETTLTPWTAGDYAPVITGSGARKLADSGIAPLVAVARGYETVTTENTASYTKKHNLGAANTAQHKQVITATRSGSDAMSMPWFRADKVAEAHKICQHPIADTVQLRPAVPSTTASGKSMKYVNLAKAATVIDLHPATPASYFTGAPKFVLTEGLLKGDAMVTAYLRENGVSDEDLTNVDGLNSISATAKLGAFMDAIPEQKRIAILSFVGVANWKGNEMWVSFPMRGRTAIVAFDGDVATNWNVWNQASALWDFLHSRAVAAVKLMDLNLQDHHLIVDMSAGGDGAPKKVGADDFLAKYGTLAELLSRVQGELPDRPARNTDDYEIGSRRVASDGLSVVRYTQTKDSEGNPTGAIWVTEVPYGGHISSVGKHRAPTDLEMRTGEFGAGVAADDDVFAAASRETCVLEIKWADKAGAERKALVSGPATMLMMSPTDWVKAGVKIPTSLMLHPAWPPTFGMDWLKAIKNNNESVDTAAEQNTSWTVMGWVPVEDSPIPSYISGRTIIAANEENRARTVAGVTEGLLKGSSGFSLPTIPYAPMSEEWKALVTQILDALYAHYIELAPWTNTDFAAVILAAGLRPTVPVRTRTVLYLQGPPRQGKSWTATHVLSFHQCCKTWNNHNMPGSAEDTAASSEQSIARSLVWMIDDLAPQSSKTKYDAQQDGLGTTIRATHNGNGKRRSSKDSAAAEVFQPRALLVVTAENEHSIGSVRDRSVILNLGQNSLRNTPSDEPQPVDIMDEFRDHNRAPGQATYASVQAFQHLAALNGWAALQESIDQQSATYKTAARTVIGTNAVAGSNATRHVDMAVDLLLGFAPLHLLAQMVGHAKFLAMFDLSNPANLIHAVSRVAGQGFESQALVTPGRTLLSAVKFTLESGRGHISSAEHPNQPPLDASLQVANAALGWVQENDIWRAKGPNLGYLIATSKDAAAADVVMLSKINSFEAAARAFPGMIPPGSTAKTAYGSVWNEELVHPHYADKRPQGGRDENSFRADGMNKKGVPVSLETLIGYSPDSV